MADGGGSSGSYAIRRRTGGRMSTDINQEDHHQRDGFVVNIESLISQLKKAEKPSQAGTNVRIMSKVPDWMRKCGRFSNKNFAPEVVALGPFHHEQSNLKRFQKIKRTAFKKCVDLLAGEGRDDPDIFRATVVSLLNAVEEEVDDKELFKYYYPEEVTATMTKDRFLFMMAIDGCFILHFIDCANKKKIDLDIGEHEVPRVVRDMFLLENQIPFAVLRALSKKMYDKENEIGEKIFQFIRSRILLPDFYSSTGRNWVGQSGLNFESLQQLLAAEWNAVAHLLHVLRLFLVGKPKGEDHDTTEKKRKVTQPPPFGSVVELKDAGIRFTKSGVTHLRGISFEKNWCFPEIVVPPIVITRNTICYILNIIALEGYLDAPSDRIVTYYTCFLISVIKQAEDVKELRLRRVLSHGLGSDKEVAELFNRWPIDLMGELQVHGHVSDSISDHPSPWKKSIAEFVRTHFRSPWSVISLAAKVGYFLLALLQTIFTIKQFSHSSAPPPPPPLV